MSSVSNYHRKRCITSGCKKFAVTKLPCLGQVHVMCKACRCDTSDMREAVVEMEECVLCCEVMNSGEKKPFGLSCCKKECCEACIIAAGCLSCPFCRQTFTVASNIRNRIEHVRSERNKARNNEIARDDALLIINLQADRAPQVPLPPVDVPRYQGRYVLPDLSPCTSQPSWLTLGQRNYMSFGYQRHNF